MKAKINNESKAKFFALYWGQLIGLGLNGQLDINKSKFKAQSAFTECIELKPLSSISDEDAIEYFDILWYENHKSKSKEFKIDLGKDWANSILSQRMGLISSNLIYGYDYLRSKGYALPWMGLSVEEMVEAGWIKLIE